jgi:hypothetical protein
MWWIPEGGHDREVALAVYRLADLFQTPQRTLPGIHGVGSTVDENGRRVPLLVVDPSLGANFGDRLSNRELRGPVFPSGNQKVGRSRLFVPLRKTGLWRRSLANWNVPEDTRIFFSHPPTPLSAAPGTRIWAKGRHATLGFPIQVGKRIVFSTAGHLVTSLPCSIVTRSRRFFGEDHSEVIGNVSYWNDPMPPFDAPVSKGIDVALVESDGNHTANTGQARILCDVATVPDLAAVNLFGARSHRRRGWINGALLVTRALDGRIWRNCWTVCEFRGGFAKQGDSGGPVILERGRQVLGHLVCALGTKSWTGRFQCGLVQDIHSILNYVELKYSVPPTILQLPIIK